MKKAKKTWVEKMREQYAHIPILSLDEIRELPMPGEYDGGIYFLWLQNELQYIGKSKNLQERIALQNYANKFAKLRASKWPKPIAYDRCTCLVLESGQIISDGLAEKLTEHERAYIAHFTPPQNYLGQNPGT